MTSQPASSPTIDLPAILNSAADLIDARGWRQGFNLTGASGGPMCLVEAIAHEVQAMHSDRYFPVSEQCWQVMRAATGYKELTTWNDMSSRTKEHVTGALRQAAREVK